MTRGNPTPPEGFTELTVEEQIAYVESLWDLITADPQEVPVPDWHRGILKERLQAHTENPQDSESWDTVRRRIERRLRERGG